MFCSTRNAEQLQVQPAERHVLAGYGHLCRLQQWTSTHPGGQFHFQLCQATGDGKRVQLLLLLLLLWLQLLPLLHLAKLICSPWQLAVAKVSL